MRNKQPHFAEDELTFAVEQFDDSDQIGTYHEIEVYANPSTRRQFRDRFTGLQWDRTIPLLVAYALQVIATSYRRDPHAYLVTDRALGVKIALEVRPDRRDRQAKWRPRPSLPLVAKPARVVFTV